MNTRKSHMQQCQKDAKKRAESSVRLVQSFPGYAKGKKRAESEFLMLAMGGVQCVWLKKRTSHTFRHTFAPALFG
jgi:hypothetical protein